MLGMENHSMVKKMMMRLLRKRKHIRYVESYVIELRSRICSQACLYGSVDAKTRDLFLKYNNYLKQLKDEYKN
jgi:hypothetical protein